MNTAADYYNIQHEALACTVKPFTAIMPPGRNKLECLPLSVTSPWHSEKGILLKKSTYFMLKTLSTKLF